MAKTIPQGRFSEELFAVLDKTFETHNSIYLDMDT